MVVDRCTAIVRYVELTRRDCKECETWESSPVFNLITPIAIARCTIGDSNIHNEKVHTLITLSLPSRRLGAHFDMRIIKNRFVIM